MDNHRLHLICSVNYHPEPSTFAYSFEYAVKKKKERKFIIIPEGDSESRSHENNRNKKRPKNIYTYLPYSLKIMKNNFNKELITNKNNWYKESKEYSANNKKQKNKGSWKKTMWNIEGNSYPLQYSSLENSIDSISWGHRVRQDWATFTSLHFTSLHSGYQEFIDQWEWDSLEGEISEEKYIKMLRKRFSRIKRISSQSVYIIILAK